MKRFAWTAIFVVIVGAGVWGCNRGPRYEEHDDSSEVSVTGDPHVSESPGGQGSGATGTGGTSPGEPNAEGDGDPDTASGGDSSN